MELIPYIMFSGSCEEALKFYANAMDGEIKNISRFGDMPGDSPMSEEQKKKIMHSNFEAGDVKFMASDSPFPTDGSEGQVNLSLNIDDAGQMEKVFYALAEGGKITMPLQDTSWGARFGMLTDKYGIKWMFNHELRK